MASENEAVPSERVGQDHPRAGVDIAARDPRHLVRMLQVPALGGGSRLQAQLLELRSPRAIGEHTGGGSHETLRVAHKFPGIYVKNFQKSIKMELTCAGKTP